MNDDQDKQAELKKLEALHEIKTKCPEKLPVATCGSYVGHCVAGSSSVGAEDQTKTNQKGI